MLARWNPFNRTAGVFSDFDSLFRDFGFGELAPGRTFGPVTWPSTLTPAADIVESEGEIQLKVDLPGHSPEDIKVELEGNTLSVTSERKSEKEEKDRNYLRTERSYGMFSRSFVLPDNVDGSKLQARYVNGVLSITLPKREEAKSKLIPVKTE